MWCEGWPKNEVTLKTEEKQYAIETVKPKATKADNRNKLGLFWEKNLSKALINLSKFFD